MSKEEKGWEDVLEKYQNQVPSTERYYLSVFLPIEKPPSGNDVLDVFRVILVVI